MTKSATVQHEAGRLTITNLPEEQRYTLAVDGEPAGFTVYHERRGDRFFFVHTEIHKEFLGTGVGKELVRHALDQVREAGGSVIPICPFVWAFIQANPEYADLVDHQIFDRVADKLHAD